MRRALAIPVLSAAVGLGAWLAPYHGAGAARAAGTDTVAVRVGDRIQVLDSRIGCRITRMRQLGRRVVVDCRRAGQLAGTYGTLFTAREAALIRFESSRRAKLVVVAPHQGEIRRCEARPR